MGEGCGWMAEGSGFRAAEDMGALDFETAVESVADVEDAVVISAAAALGGRSRYIPGKEYLAEDYGADSNAGLDDAGDRRAAAMAAFVALMDDYLPEKDEVRNGDVAGKGEGVLGDGVGSWPSRRSIPDSLPLCRSGNCSN